MTDKHVDELLADLNRALDVEPSPAVAARVRTRIAEPPAAVWFGSHWRLLAGGVAAASVIGAGYVMWPRQAAMPVVTQTVASRAADAPPVGVPGPRVAPVDSTPKPRASSRHAASVRSALVADHEPTVIVSPSQRLGLAQLAMAVRDGRITADSLAETPTVLPDPITIPVLTIEPFKVDPIPGGGGGNHNH